MHVDHLTFWWSPLNVYFTGAQFTVSAGQNGPTQSRFGLRTAIKTGTVVGLASRSSMNDAFVDQTKAFLCHDPGDIDIISLILLVSYLRISP